MKYCPQCDERYDDEIIRFCTKDGTPLIEESDPTFVEMPSEVLPVAADDDAGEITVIRSRDDVPQVPPLEDLRTTAGERIVIPTEDAHREQAVRPRVVPAYYPPPEPQNTAKTVVLTVLGTIAVLGLGAMLFWFLQRDKPAANQNLNTNLTNQSVNLNSNIPFDSNFNFNATAPPTIPNINFNANIKTPSPTPKPSPSPSTTPSPAPTVTPLGTNLNRTITVPPRPTPSPTPRQGPRPTPFPSPQR